MASNQTTNYNLNQWAAEDRVLREEFNQDNAKIDTALPRFISGSYIGTGEEDITKHYSLGCRPKLLVLRTENTFSGNTYDVGVILTEVTTILFNSNGSYMQLPGSKAGLEDDGFFIKHGNPATLGLNREGVKQNYWAWC